MLDWTEFRVHLYVVRNLAPSLSVDCFLLWLSAHKKRKKEERRAKQRARDERYKLSGREREKRLARYARDPSVKLAAYARWRKTEHGREVANRISKRRYWERSRHNLHEHLARVLRCRTRAALRRNATDKAVSTIELIGCSISELKGHLESLFRPGMTWANHGVNGWHIDHKKPCASFDLADQSQQRECFHFTNLQPLWANENIRKRDKVQI